LSTAPVVEQVKELPTIDLVEGNENSQVGILLRLKQWKDVEGGKCQSQSSNMGHFRTEALPRQNQGFSSRDTEGWFTPRNLGPFFCEDQDQGPILRIDTKPLPSNCAVC
jgi:hypothetical protein